MERKYRFGAVLGLITVMTVCVFASKIKAEAASADIQFETASTEVQVGDVFTVDVKIKCDEAPGLVMGYVSYNSDVMEFVTGPESVAGGEGLLKITDETEDMQTGRSYELYFKAVKTGSSTMTVMGAPEIYDTEFGDMMSVSSGTLAIEVKPDNKASSDASLSIVKINPGTLNPAFDTTVHEYKTTVGFETTSIYVSAVTNDSKATVKIEGNSNLSVGQNRILVLVTAEDMTTEKYVIYAIRDEEKVQTGADETGAGDLTGEGDGTWPETGATGTEAGGAENGADGSAAGTVSNGPAEGWSFYAEGAGGEVFLIGTTRYKVAEAPETLTIPTGYHKTSIIVSGFKIAAYSKDSGMSDDFLLLVLSKDGAEPGLYSYDRVEKTLQRYNSNVEKTIETSSGYATLDDKELAEGYEKSLSNLTVIIAILCGICMLLVIIVIRMAVRNRR